jgi:two-component system cell cycle sensor histidine kinase/response regulator CckA
MRSKLPPKSVVLPAYTVVAAALAAASVKWQIDPFLYLMGVPILLAAVMYPRVVSLAMQLICCIILFVAIRVGSKNPTASERTALYSVVALLAMAEALSRMKAARDRTERALRESEHRLRTIVEADPESIQLLARDGAVLDMNPAGLAMFEADGVAALRNQSVFPLVSEKHREMFRTLVEETFLGKSGALELEITGLKGAKRWILTRTAPFRDERGDTTSCVAVASDVTERKRAEARLLAFSQLARRLGIATTPQEAARIIVDVAQDLFHWDACFLHLYTPESKTITPLLTIDLIDGRRTELPEQQVGKQATPMLLRVVQQGPELVLREGSELGATDLVPLGDRSRRSASLMFVPIYNGSKAIGVLSIQSYSVRAFDQEDLQTLQALANHCAGALARIQETAERQRAEEDLRLSETRFRTVVENLGEGLLITDLEDQVLYANSRMMELCGYTLAELTGRRACELFAASENWPAWRERNARRAQGLSETYEMMLKRKDGQFFLAEVNATPFRNPAGEIIGITVALTDITERKQAETRMAALSKLGQRLSASNSPEEAARIIAGLAKELLGWDACTLVLYSAEQHLIQPVVSIDSINGQLVDAAPAPAGRPPSPMFQRVIEQGAQLILRDAQSGAPVELTPFGNTERRSEALMFVPIRDGRKVIGILSVQSYTVHEYDQGDLDLLQALADHCGGALERLRATHELRRSDERFAKAFHSSPIAIGIISLKENRLLDVNESLPRLLGHTREEMLGRTVVELGIWVHPEERDRLWQLVRTQRLVRDLECELRTKEGKFRNVLASGEMIELGGDPCLLLILQDVTERLDLEAQLRHSQKMEAVGQLSAGVAHDFNNIMTVIQGHTGLLLRNSTLDAAGLESLGQISTSAERAAALTCQLLAFSRKQIMQVRLFDLNEIVGNAAQMLHRLLGENIALKLECGARLPLVEGDVGMIEQIIVNLALNARDAMQEQGRLTISTRAVEIDSSAAQRNTEARPGHFITLRVVDTGCGMSPETLERIFEPFFTTKEVGKGTGLGLSTVYGIVKQHQGWIEVESQVGRGTTFQIFLPYVPRSVQAPAAAPTPAEASKIVGGTETILVVEDEPALRKLVRRILTLYGYRVLEAANGKEALGVWRQHASEVQLLLTDMVMPEGPAGLELAESMKSEQPKLKVIYTSGYSMDLQGRHQELREGVNFLPKPYHPPTLARVVRNCLDT